MKPQDIAIGAGVPLLWGFSFVAAKSGMTEFPPIFLVGLRFAVVAALLVGFVRPPWGRMRQIFLVSLTLGTLHFSLMFTGLEQVDAGTAAISIQLQAPFATLLAALVFGERVGAWRWAGMAIAFAGVVVIAGEPRITGNLWALGMVISAALIWAIANLQVKAMGAINGFVLNAWMSLFAAPQLLLVSSLVEDGQLDALVGAGIAGWGAVAYMVLAVTIVGYGLWYRLVGRYDMSQVMPFTLLVPVFGVMAGVLMLDEPLTWQLLLGGSLTLSGVSMIVLRSARTP